MYPDELLQFTLLQRLSSGVEWLAVSLIGVIFLTLIARPSSVRARGPFITAAIFTALGILLVPAVIFVVFLLGALDILEQDSLGSVFGMILEVGPNFCLAVSFFCLMRSMLPRVERVAVAAPTRAPTPHPLD